MRIVYSGKQEDEVRAAAQRDEQILNGWLEERGMKADVVQLRSLEAPISLLRGEHRWQLFLKMYFKGDVNAACEKLQQLAGSADTGVRAELEVNPVNLY